MKIFIALLCLCSFSLRAEYKKFEPSDFDVIPLNSPVKEANAIFEVKLPANFEVDKIKVKLADAHDIFGRKKFKFEDINLSGNQLKVNVSKLSPGFYRLYVKVVDKKSKNEHDFKSKYHDFVRFVVDSSMEVPMPSEKENNMTLAGLDKDGDGIRDDIQRTINETFASKPNTKLASKQLARVLQKNLLEANDAATAIVLHDQVSESVNCLLWVNENVRFVRKLDTLLRNTELRIRTALKQDQYLHGQGTSKAILQFEEEVQRSGIVPTQYPFCDFDAQKEN